MTNNYEAFLAARSTEVAQPCTEVTFVDFINRCIPESNIKYVITALSPLLYSKVSSTNYKRVVIVRDMLEEAVKILPELTDWEWMFKGCEKLNRSKITGYKTEMR